MERYSDETLSKVRQVDLLSYLQQKDPGNLVKAGYDTYTTREHDSLKISNGQWFWFSRRFGGISALDYLVKVKHLKFVDAVKEILDGGVVPTYHPPAPKHKKQLILPEKNNSTYRIKNYLMSRGLSPEVLHYCITNDLLYESQKYHNAVFVGYNDEKEPKYAALRSTYAAFKGEATGSDKVWSFRIAANPRAEDLHIFEAAIDLLSLASMKVAAEENWLNDAYYSLGGVSQSSARNGLPKGLGHFLLSHPDISIIHLHLDNDEPGKNAAKALTSLLCNDYLVLNEPPPMGKDMNEYLLMKQRIELNKEVYER